MFGFSKKKKETEQLLDFSDYNLQIFEVEGFVDEKGLCVRSRKWHAKKSEDSFSYQLVSDIDPSHALHRAHTWVDSIDVGKVDYNSDPSSEKIFFGWVFESELEQMKLEIRGKVKNHLIEMKKQISEKLSLLEASEAR